MKTFRLLFGCGVFAAVLAPTVALSQTSAPRTEVPRLAGKPDFTGVWAGPGFTHKVGKNDTEPNIIQTYPMEIMSPFQPGGEALLHPMPTGDLSKDDALSLCMAVGIPRSITGPFAQQWVQTPSQLVILYEWFRTFRVVPLDGRPHPKDLDPTWFGDSVGRWEGDTLLIDTIGLRAWTLDETVRELPNRNPNTKQPEFAGRWHSDALHVIERVTYKTPTVASYDITIDDPKIFTKPWTWNSSMTFHPTWKLLEMICEENNRCKGGVCKGN
jgi:hypothetical protein